MSRIYDRYEIQHDALGLLDARSTFFDAVACAESWCSRLTAEGDANGWRGVVIYDSMARYGQPNLWKKSRTLANAGFSLCNTWCVVECRALDSGEVTQ